MLFYYLGAPQIVAESGSQSLLDSHLAMEVGDLLCQCCAAFEVCWTIDGWMIVVAFFSSEGA